MRAIKLLPALAIGLCLLLLLAFMPLITPQVFVRQQPAEVRQSASVATEATRGIPKQYLELFQKWGAHYKVAWELGAGITKVESNHGRLKFPGVTSGINRYKDSRGNDRSCCRGPNQFNTEDGNGPVVVVESPSCPRYTYEKGSSWDGSKVDGNGDGVYCVFDPEDSIPAMFKKLAAQGATDRGGWRKAAFRYNRSTKYVNDVVGLARLYAKPAPADDGGSAPGDDATYVANLVGSGKCEAGKDIGIKVGSIKYKAVRLRICDLKGMKVEAPISGDLARMLAAAERDGIKLGAASTFRSRADQIRLRRGNCGTSYYAIYKMRSGNCSPPTATPGNSNHEGGRAIDFSYKGRTLCFPRPGSRCFGNPAYNWLVKNARKFGFENIPSEAWHWENKKGRGAGRSGTRLASGPGPEEARLLLAHRNVATVPRSLIRASAGPYLNRPTPVGRLR